MHCVSEFSAKGWGDSGKHEVKGKIHEKEGDKKVVATFSGKWSDSLKMKMETKGAKDEVIWQANPMPEKHDWQYYFTNFTMNLNHLPAELKGKLPRSDSRLRTDLRALEENDIDLATTEKHRLEEKQRAARKWRAENPGNDFKPKYFKKVTDPDSKEDYFAYGPEHGCRDYWQDRARQDFAHMEDLY